MEVNSGIKTFKNFHKSFTSIYDQQADSHVVFRCHPVHDTTPNAPILPDEDRIAYKKEPEYTELCFDLSQHKDIPVTLSPTLEKIENTNDPVRDNTPVHTQAKQYENVQQITASFSLKDFAESDFCSLTSDQRELLSWHNRLGHLPFSDLQRLSSTGAIPRRLQNVEHPKCVACIFGKSHRRPWRPKGEQKHHIRSPDDVNPGDNTSIDAMTSKAPGLIPQMSGFLTSKRFWAATVFVDHATNYGYVYLQEDQTLETTLAAKAAYERHANSFAVPIKRYHADNGRFADKAFQDEIAKHNQDLHFCAAGTHHQNGIAERRIRTLTELSRTYLAHAMHRWPSSIAEKCVSPILWPFALKYANDVLNNFSFDNKGLSPMVKFAKIRVSKPYINDIHTFGCPAFVLDGPLQSGNKTPR